MFSPLRFTIPKLEMPIRPFNDLAAQSNLPN